MFTDNPVKDSMTRDEMYDIWLQGRPFCTVCGYHITSHRGFRNGHIVICESCLEEGMIDMEEEYDEEPIKEPDDFWEDDDAFAYTE